jgi:murein DD-endopeptidase MepM/ murein hydrolase activator NlpD
MPSTITHRFPVALLLAIPAACSTAPEPRSEAEDLGAVAQHLDMVCTADPTKSVADDPWWGNRWASSFTPYGYDLHHVNVVGPHCESAPGTPGYDARCCEANKGTTDYQSCKDAQETAAKAFLDTWLAETPLLRPYQSDNVGVWQGYYYDTDESHTGAIDFGKLSLATGEDPSFPLYAVANGTVVYSGWLSSSAGNSVLVRHPLPGGAWYLSEYRHVRGGSDRDKKLACPCIDPTKATSSDRLAACSSSDKALAICKYAANPTYDYLWGSNSDALPALGAIVTRGQQIGASGNTGTVSGVLDSNGVPPSNGNIHVHFSFWAQRPGGVDDGNPGIDVIAVDPLGVYSKREGTTNGKGCYDVDAPTAYEPALAPFLPEFTDVVAGAVYEQPLYYPHAGWGPQTLSFYKTSNGTRAAGGFDPEASKASWKLWLDIDKATMQSKLDGYTTRKLRQISVRVSNGSPVYTGIWEGLESGEIADTRLDITDSQFDTLWANKIANGTFKMTDHVMSVVNGVNHHNVSISNKSGDFVFHWGKTKSELLALDSSLQASGWKPYAASASVGPTGSAVTYSAVWRWVDGTYELLPDLSPSTFASKVISRRALGWRLHRVQGYDNGTRMLAIWYKPAARTCGVSGCERTGVCAAGTFKWVPVCTATNKCPNGTAPVSGQCQVPADSSGNANCINTDPNNCPPGSPAGTDCRVYNWEMRQASGALCKDSSSYEICGSRESSLCDAY